MRHGNWVGRNFRRGAPFADLTYLISHIKAPPPKVLGILAVSVLFGIFWQGRVRLLACIPAGLALALWVLFPRPDVLISGDGRLIGVMVHGTRMLNSAKRHGICGAQLA